MSEPFRVSTTVDFDADGKQFGALNVPYSSNESAWGAVRIPIVVLKGGAGPTLLCTGGVHGDEYEGPIALGKLARSLEATALNGRLILLPALNLPAVLAGARVSPIDQINLNRTFPGRWDGTVTEMIADYVTRRILPLCDAVLDLHSGGRTLQFLPFCGMHVLKEPAQMARTHAAMEAFGAPFSVVIDEFDRLGMIDTAVEQLGKIFLFTELGGGGAVTAATVAIAERGIDNLLHHFGMIEGAPEPVATRLMHSPEASYFVVSEDRGIFEIVVDLGAAVSAGQPVARIHDVESPARTPATCRAERSGVLIGRRWAGPTRPGDCLAVIATDSLDR
ncbi:MAG TPA: N(2)-acetyl-L-2,4-diaminobutanoate deacetylase DoeB [Geminicoccaceae bacterium]